MKKLLLLLFVLGLMSCGQKQEATEEAPAVEEATMEMATDSAAVDTAEAMEEAAPEE